MTNTGVQKGCVLLSFSPPPRCYRVKLGACVFKLSPRDEAGEESGVSLKLLLLKVQEEFPGVKLYQEVHKLPECCALIIFFSLAFWDLF